MTTSHHYLRGGRGRTYRCGRLTAAAFLAASLSAPAWPAEEAGGWARALGGRNRDWALGVASDGGGNVYVAGHFQGQTQLGAGAPLSSAGDTDAFLVKLDPAGEVLWARRFGGPGQDEGRGVAAAGDRVLVTGFFSHAADVAGAELESAGASDVFIASLTGDGELVWARRLGGKRGDVGYKIAAGDDGSAWVTGYFQSEVDFDPGPAAAPLTSAGSTDAFVAAFDRDGGYRWARRFGGERRDQGRAIAAAGGRVAVLGNFETTAGELTSAGASDVFLWRLDDAGGELGVTRHGGLGPDSGEALALGPDGGLYATGSFYATADFAGEALSSAGLTDAFVAAFSAAGAPRWARRLGGAGSEFGFGVAAAENGLYLAGFSQLAPDEATVSGEARGFVARLDAEGEIAWRKDWSGEPAAQVLGLALDPAGLPCVAGMFKGAAEIDLGPRAVQLAGAGKFDVFAACLAVR